MIKTAAVVGLLCVASLAPVARAESPAPRAYSLKAEGALADRKMTLTLARDGERERVEVAFDKYVLTSLYDFEAHRVYWIGWAGPGSCSSGRYLSARAPVEQDPVTGTSDQLSRLAEGRSRQAAGAGPVGGRMARIESLVGGQRPTGPRATPWPTRVWLDQEGGYLLKLEGEAPGGAPMTLLEVKQLSFARPPGALLQPPSACPSTDSEMDDSGQIRGRGEAIVEVRAGGSADLGGGSRGELVSPARPAATRPRPASPLASLRSLTLSLAEHPQAGPCGTALQLTGTVVVDGPATVWFRFHPSVGGVQFPHGQVGTVTVDAAGEATLVKEAVVPRSLQGQLRLQASVQGTNGRNGPLKTSDPVPFQVTCAGK